MEVTRQNFEAVLPQVQVAIDLADFVSFDLEFTGLNKEGKRPSPTFTPNDLYNQAKSNVQQFAILQVGLCPFSWSETKQCYVGKPFNFFLFPGEKLFSCESSSMAFLASNGLDFNRVFNHGIQYRSIQSYEVEKQRVEKEIAEKSGGDAARSPIVQPSRQADKDFLSEQKAKVAEWLEGFEEGESNTLTLEPCSSFRRLLLHQHLKSDYPVTTKAEKGSVVVSFHPGGDEERAQSQQNERDQAANEKRNKLEQSVGFRRVFDHLAKSGKPLIGHNLMFDLLHVYHKLVGDFPESVDEFAKSVHAHFPTVIDTKRLVKHVTWKETVGDSSLGALYDMFKGEDAAPRIVLDTFGFNRYEQGSDGEAPPYAHEAAYDAWMTGIVFLRMVAQYAGVQEGRLDFYEDGLMDFSANKLVGFMDEFVVNLDGPNDNSTPENVFYVEFSRMNEVYEFFDAFKPFQVRRLGSNSGFVVIEAAMAKAACKKALANKTPFKILPLDSDSVPVPEDWGRRASSEEEVVRQRKRARTEATEDEEAANGHRKNNNKCFLM